MTQVEQSLTGIKPADNSLDYDMFTKLSTDTVEQSSTHIESPDASFIKKCIHPPSAIPGFLGLPTNDARSQVTLEWRTIRESQPCFYHNRPNNDNVIVGPMPTADWPTSIAFLLPNSPRVQAYSFYKTPINSTGIQPLTAGHWQQDLNNNIINTAYNFRAAWAADANVYRPAYKSHTSYLNATMFNNIGTVTVNQFTPSIMFYGTASQFAYELPEKFLSFVEYNYSIGRYRKVKKSYEDLGHPYLALPTYIRNEINERLLLEPGSILNLDPSTAIQIISIGPYGPTNEEFSLAPIPDQSQVLQTSMRSYGGRAMEGTFTVQRLNTVAPSWLTANRFPGNGFTNNECLYECYLTYNRLSLSVPGDTRTHWLALMDNVPSSPPTGYPITDFYNNFISRDCLWSKDMTWSWVVYQGLSYSPTSNLTGNVAPGIIIHKFYSGFEVQPSIMSPWSGLIQLGPKPNLEAMQALMDAF
jgi:hypothetical protein